MKRFITYVYEYKGGQKIRGAGYIRVDVRNQILQLMLNIKALNLKNERGDFVLFIKNETYDEVSLDELVLREGIYNGRMLFDFGEKNIFLENMIGVAIRFEDGTYMASCWKDGEEDAVAAGRSYKMKKELEVKRERLEEVDPELVEESMKLYTPVVEQVDEFRDLQVANFDPAVTYCKINLNEIHSLPSRHWHYANNSFLIHGFWNYGYLVLKESVEESEKRMSLGVPGIFEQPEMVMATYFGFPAFEILPTQVETMEIGVRYSDSKEKKNQQTKVGLFGCWFVDL